MPTKFKILYLEDDPDLGAITNSVLTKEGFEVTWAKNGDEGLKLYSESRFDIGIIDIMMPKLDGYSFVAAIRAKDVTTPLIFLSARVLTEDVLKGFQIGADDYIRKPFSIEELIARINRLVQKNNQLQTTSTVFSIGTYMYDRNTLELKSPDGRNTFLSPRAGELLDRLIKNKDHMLVKKDTLLELWGDDSFFNGRSLDVFISKLRKQLSADPSIRIVNIRAQGYRLIY